MYLRYGAARAAADKCCVCENHFKRFELARVALKHDRRAKLMSERLALFVDSRVSWAAACVSSSAVEIIFSKRQLQSVLFLPVLVWSVRNFVMAFILSSKIIDNPQVVHFVSTADGADASSPLAVPCEGRAHTIQLGTRAPCLCQDLSLQTQTLEFADT
jgi:hypothetical protein